ncbi:restriction endonuclease subunit S [Pseudomonas fluorescens]|nr:restriction endonuclease subunit S [Pseudomonas fluorescens]
MTLANTYPGYRTARMRWLPSVPEHWNEQRAKTFFREVDERSKTGQEELLSVSHLTGVTPRSQKNVTMFKAASYVGSKLCRPGDIVINTLWAWMAALGASRHLGIVSPAYGVYRPHKSESFNPAYLDYLLRTSAYVAEYIGRSTGIRSSRLRLYPNQFLDISIIQPPRSEQDQIVAYLRAQDAHIARFIKAKRELIGLLTEQKLQIIDYAVTRGLDASVKLKPSGIEWLGDIPAAWDIARLRTLTSRITSGSRGWSDYAADKGPLFLRIGNLARGSLKLNLDRVVRLELPLDVATEAARTRVRTGDILLSITAYIGSVAHVPEGLPEAYVSQHVACCTLRPEAVDSKWAAYVLLSSVGRTHGAISMYGGTKQGLTLSDVKNYLILLPPRDEQLRLVAEIDSKTAAIDAAIEKEKEAIALIREYRDCLIFNAVTGQVDVRDWRPGPDDIVSDEILSALADDEGGEADEEEDRGED